MTMTVALDRSRRADAVYAAIGLAISGLLTAVAPIVGAVHASDDSSVWFAPGASWLLLLPAVVVAVLAFQRPVAALAVAAGAGVIGLARLLTDLPVVTDPDALARPDLFVETTDRSLPFSAAAGGYLLLLADAVALLIGVAAAWRLSTRVEITDRDDVEVRRNSGMLAVGFVGVLLLAIGALAVPYQGGYLSARFVAVGVPLVGFVGAVVLACLAALAVVAAGSLPRVLAIALLGGVALGAGSGELVAVVAVVSAPTELSQTVWLALVGAVILAGAGLLTRTGLADVRGDDRGVVPPRAADETAGARAGVRLTLVAGVLAAIAAALCVVAASSRLIDAGGLEDMLFLVDGSPIPGSRASWWAAALLVCVAALALIRPTAAAGRAALLVVCVAPLVPMTLAIDVFSDNGIASARSMGLVSVGWGTWGSIAAAAVALVAGICAAIGARQFAQASLDRPDDDGVARQRAWSIPIATVVAAAAIAAGCLPVYEVSASTVGPTLLQGYTVQVWGAWALCLSTCGALIAAARATRPAIVAAVCGAAAALQATRLVIPSRISSYGGFRLQPGVGAVIVVVVLLIAAGVILAVRARGMRAVRADDAGDAATVEVAR